MENVSKTPQLAMRGGAASGSRAAGQLTQAPIGGASRRLEDGLVGSATPSVPPQGGRHLSGWRCGLTDREQVVDRSPPVADVQAAPFVERQPHKLLGASNGLTQAHPVGQQGNDGG